MILSDSLRILTARNLRDRDSARHSSNSRLLVPPLPSFRFRCLTNPLLSSPLLSSFSPLPPARISNDSIGAAQPVSMTRHGKIQVSGLGEGGRWEGRRVYPDRIFKTVGEFRGGRRRRRGRGRRRRKKGGKKMYEECTRTHTRVHTRSADY